MSGTLPDPLDNPSAFMNDPDLIREIRRVRLAATSLGTFIGMVDVLPLSMLRMIVADLDSQQREHMRVQVRKMLIALDTFS